MMLTDEEWQSALSGEGPVAFSAMKLQAAVRRVRNLCMHPDDERRREALFVAGRLGTTEALMAAAEYWRDPSLDIRRALLSLAVDVGAEGTPILRKLAADPDPHVAVDAIRRLTHLRDGASTSRIRSLLKAKHAIVRGRAAIFLGTVGGPSVVPILERLKDDEDQGVRDAVEWALQELRGPNTAAHAEQPDLQATVPESSEATPAPSPAAQPSFADLALEASEAGELTASLKASLATLGDSALSTGLRALRPGGSSRHSLGGIAIIAGLGDGRWLTPLRKLTTDPHPDVRAACADALGSLATVSTLSAIETLLRDSEEHVAAASARALAAASIRLKRASHALKTLRSIPLPDHGAFREAVLKAIAELEQA